MSGRVLAAHDGKEASYKKPHGAPSPDFDAFVRRYFCCSPRATRDLLKTLTLLCIFVSYLFIFAYILQATEAEAEIEFNENYVTLMASIKQNISAEAYANLVEVIGIDDEEGTQHWVSYVPNSQTWTKDDELAFFSSYYYCFTLATTVGYGDFSPITFEGKLASIFCIIIGIPIALAAYSQLAESLFKVVMSCMLRQTRKFRTVMKLFDEDGSGSVSRNELLKALHHLGLKVGPESVDAIMEEFDVDGDGELSVTELAEAAHSLDVDMGTIARNNFKLRFAIGLLFGYMIIMAITFGFTYGLEAIDAVWFTVVTFTTVGLGDITPPRESRFSLTMIVLVALGFFAMLIDAIGHKVKRENNRILKKSVAERRMSNHVQNRLVEHSESKRRTFTGETNE